MRIIPAAAALVAAFTVASCDINTGAQKDAKAPCNCTAPPAAPAAPATGEASYRPMPHHHYGHSRFHTWRYAGGGRHGYAWRREYAELSVVTYDYRSDSHSYYLGARDGYGGEGSGGDGYRGEGYRRDHDGDRRSAHDDRARLSPWHGYDADCPDGERR